MNCEDKPTFARPAPADSNSMAVASSAVFIRFMFIRSLPCVDVKSPAPVTAVTVTVNAACPDCVVRLGVVERSHSARRRRRQGVHIAVGRAHAYSACAIGSS